MSVDFDAYLSHGDALLGGIETAQAQNWAALAWARIQEKPSSIVFRTPAGATLAAQTVRVERDNSASLTQSIAGTAPRALLILFGIRHHATQTDTNLDEGYRFNFEGDAYRIIDVIRSIIGEVQAIAEIAG